MMTVIVAGCSRLKKAGSGDDDKGFCSKVIAR